MTRAARSKPELIGKVTSINASLIMAIGDASVLATWGGIGDGGDLDDTDWDRARVAVSATECAPVNMNDGQSALALWLGMGLGIVDIYRASNQLVLVEGWGEIEDELFAEWVASPPNQARQVGVVPLPTKTLVLLPSTDFGTNVKVKGKVAKFGDENAGCAIDFGHEAATLELEQRTKGSWGRARRCFVMPA